ncbi:glycosyltransferase family 2 protein [Aquimarina sp. BL5]|uniref:dolichyl-phosphate beta-glucosyltransferase n=1 Tax=Aquimarina sp. BL5 TaxID=1714860 RepID=UPI000E4EBE54|nr:dolichyl-phosphate beta-glucosyltransferase [Aquimarina sp. BL5]AXT52592.1 glycosyltransferase family 2 protein [Aquimarina sp. BL5]RKN11656.1 glycosyltransferase [Aquimarina sp. BL5]
MKKTGIIIPCYNEYYRLEKEKFCKFLNENPNYHLCFVNDGSSDKTSEMLHQLKKTNYHKISVIDLEVNQGKATAVQTGANYLNTLSYIDNIAFLDADLSTSLEELDNLVQKLNSNDQLKMVFGSRKAESASEIERSFMRKILSNFVGFFIRVILQLPIKDTQCGAKVFKKEIIDNIYHKRFISRWLFDIEIFLRLKKHIGLKDLLNTISEEPLDSWIEVEGSKITIKDSFLIPFNLILIWANYLTIRTESKSASDIFNLKTQIGMVR